MDPLAHRGSLSGLAAMYGLQEVPEVEIRRVIEPHEWQSVLTRCMAEQGYTKGPDGTWPGIPVEQKDSFNTALYVCHAEYPVPTIYSEPWTSEQKRAMYRYTVDKLLPCLAAEGFTVDDVPSEDRFVATFDSEPWWPYGQIDLSAMTQADLDSLNQRCPQTPPLSVLQGPQG